MDKNSILGKHMLQQAKKIAIFGHMSPDGDCIGAMLGLGKLLENQKKKVFYFVPGKPSKIFDFVQWINKIKTNFDYKVYDLIVFVDFTWPGRIGIFNQANPSYFMNKPILIFDHHLEKHAENAVCIKDTKSISACEIIFEHTRKWRPECYDKTIATHFYMGITSDSWNFLFEEDHIRTFSNVVKLLKLWADKDLVVNNLFRKKSLNAIRFLQVLLSRMKQKERLLYTYYDENELKEYAIDQEEAAYVLHIIQNINGQELVLLVRKKEDIIKGSLRTKSAEGELRSQGKIDCNIIAQALWWWGHKFAAGFIQQATGNFEEQIDTIVKKINSMVDKK